MANPPKEKTITNNILKYLRSLPDVHAVKVHQSQYGSGQADISGVINGLAFQIEVKRPGNKPTELQLKCLREWQEAGALVGVCYSVDDVKAMMESSLADRETMEEEVTETTITVIDEVMEMDEEEFERIKKVFEERNNARRDS